MQGSALHVATPLVYTNSQNSPKRVIDECGLCYSFQKRLRLDDSCVCDTGDGSSGAYQLVNGLLNRVHTEHVARRAAVGGFAAAANVEQIDWSSSEPLNGSSTWLSLTDVVKCDHGSGGRCLQCSGRLLPDVPFQAYIAFCRAYGDLTSASCSTLRPEITGLARLGQMELTFTAFASLSAVLAPRPDERLLVLGSGTGRAVLAWVLIHPQSFASGLERFLPAHRFARAAASQLEPGARQRLRLHHCEPGALEAADFAQAGIVLLAGVVDAEMPHVAERLCGARPGARVVVFGSGLPSGFDSDFELVRQALYRTIRHGNTTALIYRRL